MKQRIKNKYTIGISAYNTDISLLKKCIESVRKQTYQNYELVIVDNNSDDQELKKFYKNLKLKDNEKIVYLPKNIGIYGSRNTVIDNSEGDRIVFLDSDDYISPNFLQTVEEKMIDCNVLHFNYYKIEKNNIIANDFFFEYGEHFLYSTTTWSFVVERDFLIRNNIKFFKIDQNEDECFLMLMLIEPNLKFKSISDKLYFYNKSNENALSKKFNPINLLKAMNQIIKHVLDVMHSKKIKKIPNIFFYHFYRYISVFPIWKIRDGVPYKLFRKNIKYFRRMNKKVFSIKNTELGLINTLARKYYLYFPRLIYKKYKPKNDVKSLLLNIQSKLDNLIVKVDSISK